MRLMKTWASWFFEPRHLDPRVEVGFDDDAVVIDLLGEHPNGQFNRLDRGKLDERLAALVGELAQFAHDFLHPVDAVLDILDRLADRLVFG